MRMHRLRVRRVHRCAVLVSALVVLGAVTATAAEAGTNPTPWSSIRQVALAEFNGRLYMAWMDAHANDELTIAYTTDGIHFSAATHPFGSGNSGSAPALASFNGKLWMAWTGTDANNTLNLGSSADGTTFTQETLPLGHNNSPDGPALAVFNSKLYYAWKGTDSNHTLNIASSANGSTFTAPIQPGGNSSINAPALAPWNGKLYMAWSGTDTHHLLNLASSSDGVNFTQFHFQAIGSNFQPSLSPNPFNGALDIDYQDPQTFDVAVISYVGSPLVDPTLLAGPIVQAPTVTAYLSTMVHAWLVSAGDNTGHGIDMCFMNVGPPFC